MTRLERAITPLCEDHPGECGILALDDSLDAFAARYRLTEMAERTTDVQYYIWENDMSGLLLFSVLLAAAKRGVRVRLLLDDNNTPGLDDTLRLLDKHPNIEVRLFNPFSFRILRALGYLTDFARLNRRMHNKSYTADGVVTLVGGRNIGDAYFGAGEQPLFSDWTSWLSGRLSKMWQMILSVTGTVARFQRYKMCLRCLSQILCSVLSYPNLV